MTLQDLAPGATGTISGFAADLPATHRERLEDLGFRTGAAVTCTRSPGFGAPRVYAVHGSVYSVDRGVAGRVEVAP